MKTPVRRSVEIKRIDSGRRVVYGEVMLAAPDMKDGDVVLASQLAGSIHFDGAFMTQASITELLDRFATKRPSIDVEHNGIPVGATVVESFQARAGDPEYAVGAWVVGVMLHDANVWERVERGELRAFSIQFMVRVDEVNVTIVLDDGAQMPTQLIRFSNGDPQFLSLVHQPATGAMWKHIDRSMEMVLRDATNSRWTMPQEDKEETRGTGLASALDAAIEAKVTDDTSRSDVIASMASAAGIESSTVNQILNGSINCPPLDRLEGFASALGVSLDSLTSAAEGDGCSYTPAETEESLSEDVKAEGMAKRLIKMIRRGIMGRAEDDEDDDDDDDKDKDKNKDKNKDNDKDKDEAFPGAAEAFKAEDDPEEDDPDPEAETKQQGTTDPAAEVNRAEMFADLLSDDATTMRHGVAALAATAESVMATSEGDDASDTEKMRAALMDFATWGSSMLDSDDGGLDAFVAELAERSAEAETDVERGAFSAAIAAQDVREDIWNGAYTLMDTLGAIAASDDADKATAMKLAVAEFGVWINAKVDAMVTSASLSAEAFDVSPGVVERAGKKIAGKRLAALKDLAGKLAALIDDLDDIVIEDVENSERSGDDPEAPATSDDGTAPAAAGEVERSADSGDAAQATVKDPAALLQALEELVGHNEKLEERLRTLETARPPASGAGGGHLPSAPKSALEVLMPALGFGQHK